MTGRIIIHIGAHKTGSTYLQKRWREHAAHLRKIGVYMPILPETAKMAGNAKILPVAIDKMASLTFRRTFPQIDIAGLEPKRLIDALLKNWRRDQENLLLSAENFRSQHAGPMRELLPKDVECLVVVLVRSQDAWVDSYFNQLTKTNDIDMNIGEFVDRICRADDGRILVPDWLAVYTAWRDAFGRCEVLCYQEARGDLMKYFSVAAGLPSLPDMPDIPPTQVSLGVHALTYLRQRASHVDFPEFLRRRSASEVASRCLGAGKISSLLAATDRRRLIARFSISNTTLLAVIGRGNCPALLDMEAESADYCDLTQVQGTADYARFRELADAAYDRHGSATATA